MWMVFYFWFIESVSIIDIGTTWVFSQSSDLQQLHKQYTKQQQKQTPRTQATIIIAIAKKENIPSPCSSYGPYDSPSTGSEKL